MLREREKKREIWKILNNIIKKTTSTTNKREKKEEAKSNKKLWIIIENAKTKKNKNGWN